MKTPRTPPDATRRPQNAEDADRIPNPPEAPSKAQKRNGEHMTDPDPTITTARVTLHVIACRTCSVTLPLPFESPEARDAWASEHTAATGHDQWLIFDQEEPA